VVVDAKDLIEKCLSVPASLRPTLEEVLSHRWTCTDYFPGFDAALSWWRHQFPWLTSPDLCRLRTVAKQRLRCEAFVSVFGDLIIHTTMSSICDIVAEDRVPARLLDRLFLPLTSFPEAAPSSPLRSSIGTLWTAKEVSTAFRIKICTFQHCKFTRILCFDFVILNRVLYSKFNKVVKIASRS